MSKKRLLLFTSVGLLGLLLVSLVGATLVSAEETDPTAGEPGVDEHWGMIDGGGRSWAVFDAAAEALGLGPEGLFAELHDAGKTLAEVAGGRRLIHKAPNRPATRAKKCIYGINMLPSPVLHIRSV
ncbi:MAG TPA: hypothetical protein VMW58_08360 [Anaerolineae bacterium]|nr:hypothetical protein [Anaerolineae bacterium]